MTLQQPALFCLLTLALAAPAARAQATAPQRATPPAAAASAPEAQRIEINAQRDNDTEARRRSTAAKIVIGRDEIEKFGDSTVGEILRRLPGVTSGGAPGRGGAPRMRGLGGGYTQLLLDGERVPPGFSLESLSPEQIERIEVLRAPTAETGARAMAGTINIITREGFSKKLNDLRLGLEHDEAGRWRPSASYSVNAKFNEQWNGNFSATLQRHDRVNDNRSALYDLVDFNAPSPVLLQRESNHAEDRRRHGVLSARLQYQGPEGSQATLAPFMVLSDGSNRRSGSITDKAAPLAGSGVQPAAYDQYQSYGDGNFAMLRLNANARQRLASGTRLEWRANVGGFRFASQSQRVERLANGTLLDTTDDDQNTREHSASLGAKATRLLDNGHSLVGGLEFEAVRRQETRSTLVNGVAQNTEFGDNLQASSRRSAAYLQDEWSINPNWAAHAGLRWEAITTRGAAANNLSSSNRSAVWTPLLHAVYKPDAAGRDQLRMSLTRSYKTPTTQQLIGKPSLSNTNSPTRPDRAGNPGLQPELASGVDVALERYLPSGGLLSANLFHRRITNLIRNQLQQQANGRWLSSPQNIGNALTQGLELEAKFRFSALWPEAPNTDLRANLSVYRSRVDTVPGPDNRLEQQAGATLNLGADHRFKGVPLQLGGTLAYTPGYSTRLADQSLVTVSRKRVFDAYALWTFKPGLALRLSLGNMAPEDFVTTTWQGREAAEATAITRTMLGLRLEIKL